MTDTLPPGLLIAAPRSGSGKTTITLGLLRALVRHGLKISAFKNGPDYIDPAFHTAATGRPSFNLDSFAMTGEWMIRLVKAASENTDLIVTEGSMGLFDGVRAPQGCGGATADLAALFGWPVVLVLDVSGQAQSAAAVALGCARFDPRLQIAGVILNQVASARQRRLIEEGMARAGIRVLGTLRRSAELKLPERHLGLVQAGETQELHAHLDRLADALAAEVSLDVLRGQAASGKIAAVPGGFPSSFDPPGQRIAVARDAAFSFLYPHVAESWRSAGADLIFFSPLNDEPPPLDCDACWLPGGYPELHAGRISAARTFVAGLRRLAEQAPVHGECGGYMVLGRFLEDAEGIRHEMAGLLPVETSFARRKLHLGYRKARLFTGDLLIGHEFHYASVTGGAGDETDAFARIEDAEGTDLGWSGHRKGHVTGSFFHSVRKA